jgi:hypothetical protein
LADSFNPDANGSVDSMGVLADGKILAGGSFVFIGGQTRNYIARLDATTGLADSFDPNARGPVVSITVQADGKILAGGRFSNVGGQTRQAFARLSNDTAALQNLAVTQTTINWTGGGSNPQSTRVTFESSTDNVTYTPLGDGIPQSGSSDWTLTGLSLPAGQNFYIRARGYYRGGSFNGSESITESVRNAFIVVPAPTPTPTLTPTPTPTATPAPTPITISGTISYCSNPVPGPVPSVTLTLTGTASGSTLSDISGNYQFSSLASGGTYTVTPTKAARTPGSAGIDTVDALATQMDYLAIAVIPPGCQRDAADVNDDNRIDTFDAMAIQRFYLGRTFGLANVGKYKFTPASRTYTSVITDQTAQDYDTLIFGDVVTGFVHRPNGPSQAGRIPR